MTDLLNLWGESLPQLLLATLKVTIPLSAVAFALALLIAVFPANVYMAQQPQKFGVPAWVAWARLPLQPLLFWWVLRAGRAGTT